MALDGDGFPLSGHRPYGDAVKGFVEGGDATTKADAAADATTKANAAQAAAATDATTKANAAQANAVGLAATDATTKANAAQAAAATDATAKVKAHTDRVDNPHVTTKAQVGLGNVDNTSDTNKPVSTAQAAAIATAKTQAEATASGDATAKVAAHAASSGSDVHTNLERKWHTVVPTGVIDLNTYVEPGRYAIASGNVSAGSLNLPVASFGYLDVSRGTGSSIVVQRFTGNGNSQRAKAYQRITQNSGTAWTDWAQEVDSVDAATLTPRVAPALPGATTDLNTIVRGGRYTLGSNGTIENNFPVVNFQGILDVSVNEGGTIIVQMAIGTSGSGPLASQIWYRTAHGAGLPWKPWVQIPTAGSVNTLLNTLTISSNGIDQLSVEKNNNPTDQKRWAHYVDGTGTYHIVNRRDDGSSAGLPLSFSRDNSVRLAGVTRISGVGSPEGVVTASVGTEYTDTAATNGAIRWIKAIGVGATGWKVEYGDTGWRDFRSTLDATQWSLDATVANTHARIRRMGTQVSVVFMVPVADARIGTARSAGAYDLPVQFQGFKVPANYGIYGFADWYSAPTSYPVSMSTSSRLSISMSAAGSTLWAAGQAIRWFHTWTTDDAWPSILPGTAV